jgi:hypothetical protein
VGRTAGVSEQQLMALPDFESSPTFNDVEKLVLRYAEAMTLTPVEVSEGMFGNLRLHFDDRQLVELTSAIAWENYRARFDHAFGIEAEGFYRGRSVPAPATRNQKRETRNVLAFLIEIQRRRIHTVPLPGRPRSIVENMTEMRAALFAHHFHAAHSVG